MSETDKTVQCEICGDPIIEESRLCDRCYEGLKYFPNRESLQRAIYHINPYRGIKVLDHGYIDLIDFMGGDLTVVNSARVSFNVRHEGMDDRDKGLINFLIKHRHGTPTESSVFTFRVKAPIFVFRDWIRHRISSFNEWSSRYSELTDDFYIPEEQHCRTQVGKPGNYQYVPVDSVTARWFRAALRSQSRIDYDYYKKAIEAGIALEQAKFFLPVNLYSVLYWTVNARSLMNFLNLRNSPRAQWEIQQYAEIIETIFSEMMPITASSFITNGRVAP